MPAKAIGNLLLPTPRSYSALGRKKTIRHLSGTKDDAPILIIENTGVHIVEDALPHLFDAFYREGTLGAIAQTGGSGLGLYLAGSF